jgi:hypothetical protein
MSLLISGDLRLAKGYDGFTDDADATAYLAAVQAADGQVLEPAVRLAVNSFIKGCKADGIWTAIKASCILAGARTLAGALVPLVGPTPTNNNFVSGDYNRKTGLVGNGSTKYLDTNQNNNADPQDSSHNSAYISTLGTGVILAIAANTANTGSNTLQPTVCRNRSYVGFSLTAVAGFYGSSRSNSSNFLVRNGGTTSTASIASQTPFNAIIRLFGSDAISGTHRVPFYSIGESLDLALLDARVTDLINAFAAAIP